MDRKALIREYKERRPPMGTYRIKNVVTGHCLVAAARDVPSMLNRHKAQLRMGAHSSRDLQADWAAHGPDSFVFEVLELLPPPEDPARDPLGDLVALEDLWLEKLGVPGDRMHSIDPARLKRRS